MDFSEKFLNGANKFISFIMTLVFLILGSYGAYALWDNNKVYAAAKNVQADMLKLKPEVDLEGKASFEELLAINPDVCAWVSLDNTTIDYPILQGETNLSYINTDVYGDFALAGSIFLDTRSDRNFHDPYSLVYGHDMVEGRMFGDLSLYKNEKFFNENSTGELILPDRSYNLKIYAAITESSDEIIFNPDSHKDGLSGLMDYTEKNALYIRSEMTEDLMSRVNNENLQILSLTTCSAEFTDARTIILAVMENNLGSE
ncbi:MAG: class B sortase [Clostridium sp.]|nr:class B sortase [Clostridium sp.]